MFKGALATILTKKIICLRIENLALNKNNYFIQLLPLILRFGTIKVLNPHFLLKCLYQEEFEDIKGVIRNGTSKDI
jgi:hypothetical protein